jgi:hypothetical protein
MLLLGLLVLDLPLTHSDHGLSHSSLPFNGVHPSKLLARDACVRE